MEIQTNTSEVTINTDTTVEIDSKLPEASVDITKSITAEIQPENYVLTSGGIYTGNLTGAIPTWILDAINQELTTGDGNLTSVLNDMQILLDDLQLGVNQAISQIENTNTSLSALETSLSSQIGTNSADILDVYATRVTATEAQAIATTAIGTTFNNNVDAYIGNLASVYTAPGSATATNISTLQTSYNDQTARIDSIEYATTDEFGYSLGASKLGTAPDGSITGWQFTDGTGVQSEFKIQAQKFSISDGTTGYTPFLIDGTDIKFNGLVEFTGLGIDSNSTTIDGGKIATNTLNAETIIAGGTITSPYIYGSVIEGGTISGVNINGAVIKASWMDYSTTGVLTNWKEYGPGTLPPIDTYFARNSQTGELIVTDQGSGPGGLGYYRLPKVYPFATPVVSYHNDSYNGSWSESPVGINIYPYNSYTVDSDIRLLDETSTLTVNHADSETMIAQVMHAGDWTKLYYHTITFVVFGVTYQIYSKADSDDFWYWVKRDGVTISSGSDIYRVLSRNLVRTEAGLEFRIVLDSHSYEGFTSLITEIYISNDNFDATLTSTDQSEISIAASGYTDHIGYAHIDIPSFGEYR